MCCKCVLALTNVARSSQTKGSYALRKAPLDSSSGRVALSKFRRLLILPKRFECQMLRIRQQADGASMLGLRLGTVEATGTNLTLFATKPNSNYWMSVLVDTLIPLPTQLPLRTAHLLILPVDCKACHVKSKSRLGLPAWITRSWTNQFNVICLWNIY